MSIRIVMAAMWMHEAGWQARTCDGKLGDEVFEEGIHAAQAAAFQGFQDGRLLRMALQLHRQVHRGRKPEQAT